MPRLHGVKEPRWQPPSYWDDDAKRVVAVPCATGGHPFRGGPPPAPATAPVATQRPWWRRVLCRLGRHRAVNAVTLMRSRVYQTNEHCGCGAVRILYWPSFVPPNIVRGPWTRP